MEYDYSWVYCRDCNTTLVVESRLENGCERFEQVVCPGCGGELGEIRADFGYDFVGVACGYLHPDRPCPG